MQNSTHEFDNSGLSINKITGGMYYLQGIIGKIVKERVFSL